MCAHATYARVTSVYAPGKLISGYRCGIIVFAFHLSCLHICLHPSFSFRLTRPQIQLAIRPPFYGVRLPSSLLPSLQLSFVSLDVVSRMFLIVYLNCIFVFSVAASSIVINIKTLGLFVENIVFFKLFLSLRR